jgi:hypothetical protein
LALPGCEAASVDPHHPGADLGAFRVDADRTKNVCGASALGGSPAKWTFDLRLRRGDGELYWDNGVELIIGTKAEGESFAFDTGVVVDMREGSGGGLPPCAIARHDRATIKLDAEADAFTGDLSYDFAPTEGSDCADLVTGAMPSFAALPCAMSYGLKGTRSEAPAPAP